MRTYKLQQSENRILLESYDFHFYSGFKCTAVFLDRLSLICLSKVSKLLFIEDNSPLPSYSIIKNTELTFVGAVAMLSSHKAFCVLREPSEFIFKW